MAKRKVIIICNDVDEVEIEKRTELDGDTGGRVAGMSVSMYDGEYQMHMHANTYSFSATLVIGRACDQKSWSRVEIEDVRKRAAEYAHGIAELNRTGKSEINFLI